MGEKGRVLVAGPLAAYAAGFGGELERLGYSRFTAEAELRLMAHVSAWLQDGGLEAGQLTTARVEEYLVYRRASGHVRRLSPRGMAPLLAYLRGLGVASAATAWQPVTATDRLLVEFEEYLIGDRGLAARTVEGYRRVARAFSDGRCVAGDDLQLGCVTAADVSAFMLEQSARRGVGSLGNVVTALRALLRFLYLRHYTAMSLAAAVPAACPARRAGPSRALAASDVKRLLASCDGRTKAGRRDYAVLALLARLGLRAGEVAALTLEDVDWRAGEIVVAGKGGRRDRLPLPVDVGDALAGYLQLSWWIVALNLVGSVAFGVAAIASLVDPSTQALVNARIANAGTSLGAACFLAGALLLPREAAAERRSRESSDSERHPPSRGPER